MDKTKLEISRGEEAQALLNNPMVKEFFTKVRDDIVNSMATSPLGDDKTHNRLVIALQVLNNFEKAFKDVVNTGKMAKIQVENTLTEKVVRQFRR